MQPSDSRTCVGLGFGRPVHLGLPEAEASSLRSRSRGVGRPRVPPRTRGASGSGHRVPVAPDMARGQMRVSQVPGPSPSRMPRSRTPPDPTSPRPCRGRRCCREAVENPRHPGPDHSGAYYPRLTRSHAYASPGHVTAPWRKTCYRPAGLSSSRTGFAPAGRRTGFRKPSACLLLPDQPCLVARRV